MDGHAKQEQPIGGNMLHLLATDVEGDLYIIWDWMQAIMGLLLDWNPVF